MDVIDPWECRKENWECRKQNWECYSYITQSDNYRDVMRLQRWYILFGKFKGFVWFVCVLSILRGKGDDWKGPGANEFQIDIEDLVTISHFIVHPLIGNGNARLIRILVRVFRQVIIIIFPPKENLRCPIPQWYPSCSRDSGWTSCGKLLRQR